MHDELVRAAVAVPVASLLGLPLARVPRLWRILVAGALVILALADHLGSWQAWVAMLAAVVASAFMPPPPVVGADGKSTPWVWAAARAVALTAGATGVAAFIIDTTATTAALESLGSRQSLVIVIAGGLIALFVGGEVIARVMHPFALKLGSSPAGMENAGLVIGWLERALLYSLVLAGAPDAAALIIAGKSIARFPSFKEEAFAEYYLIGSLMSLTVAAGAAIAARAALGLSLLPSVGG